MFQWQQLKWMVVSLIQLFSFQIQYKSQRITKTKSYGNNLRYTNNNVQKKKNGKSYLLT